MSTQPITVLIEQPDFVPFAPSLRRTSATAALSHHPHRHHHHSHTSTHSAHSHPPPGGSPHNSVHSLQAVPAAGPGTAESHNEDNPSIPSASASTASTTTTTAGRQANRNSIAGSTASGNPSTKEWNRRQRTSTTFHPSIDVPDSLLAALSSNAIGERQLWDWESAPKYEDRMG